MSGAGITLDEALEIERRGWDSLCSHTGGAFYGALMASDALMVLVNGMVLDRAAVVASLDDSPAWESYEIASPRLVPTGDDSAALVYTATASRSGDDEPFVALMSSHYIRVDGALRLALYQQTTITHPGQ